MAALLIALSTLTSLAEGLFIKRYNQKHTKGGFLFTAMISVFALLFFVVTDKGGITIPPLLWGYGIIGGIFYSTASFMTYIALGCGSFAMSMLILSYSLVFPIGYGLVFLHEKVSVLTVIGILIMLVSIYFVRAKREATGVKVTAKWLVSIFASVVLAGLYSVTQRAHHESLGTGYTNEFMIISLSVSVIILTIGGIVTDGKDIKYVLKYGTVWTLLAGVSNACTNLMGLVLYRYMPISILSPVRAGAKIIVSFLLSLIIFKEKFEKKQILGVCLGTAALVLLNL